MSPIHASVFITFTEFTDFNETSAPFRKNSIVQSCTICGQIKSERQPVSKISGFPAVAVMQTPDLNPVSYLAETTLFIYFNENMLQVTCFKV